MLINKTLKKESKQTKNTIILSVNLHRLHRIVGRKKIVEKIILMNFACLLNIE